VAEEILFDRAEQQFVTLVDGDGLETVYLFGGYDDDQWVELDKMQPFTFELEEGDGMAPAPTDFAGTDWYFDTYCQDVKGFDELPENWKVNILSDEKAEAVNNLFAVQVMPPPKSITPGIKRRLSGGDVTYTLRVPLHRRGMRGYCDLDHTLRPRNDAALRKFVAISGRAVLKADKQFIRQDARALGKLYDAEIVTADAGYKSPVPLFHKVAVIRAHYAAKVQAARKK
jgi:hypothetical protein